MKIPVNQPNTQTKGHFQDLTGEKDEVLKLLSEFFSFDGGPSHSVENLSYLLERFIADNERKHDIERTGKIDISDLSSDENTLPQNSWFVNDVMFSTNRVSLFLLKLFEYYSHYSVKSQINGTSN